LRENIRCPDRIKFKVVERMKERYEKDGYQIDVTDGVRIVMEEGWVLVRPSNTEPKIRITVEARTKSGSEKLLSKFKMDLMDTVNKFI
jgi:phosphomannomutase